MKKSYIILLVVAGGFLASSSLFSMNAKVTNPGGLTLEFSSKREDGGKKSVVIRKRKRNTPNTPIDDAQTEKAPTVNVPKKVSWYDPDKVKPLKIEKTEREKRIERLWSLIRLGGKLNQEDRESCALRRWLELEPEAKDKRFNQRFLKKSEVARILAEQEKKDQERASAESVPVDEFVSSFEAFEEIEGQL